MANEKIGTTTCPSCDKDADVRKAKTGKPYVHCDDCGYQGFARGATAVANLTRKMKPVAPAATATPPAAAPAPQPAPQPVKKKGFLDEFFSAD